MEDNSILTPIIITEKYYTGDDHKGSSVNDGHIIIKGTNKVLVSASRGIRHTITEDGELEYIGNNQEFRIATEELFKSYGISLEFRKNCQAKLPVVPANKIYRNTGIPSVQLLINIDYRNPKRDLEKYLNLNAALNKYISLSMEIFNNHAYRS